MYIDGVKVFAPLAQTVNTHRVIGRRKSHNCRVLWPRDAVADLVIGGVSGHDFFGPAVGGGRRRGA
jgi:hypothetical protein